MGRSVRLLLLAWLSGLALFAAPAYAAAPQAPLDLSVSVKQQQPLVITAQITNRTGAECPLATVPDGVLRVVSVTRDGTAVAPQFGNASYIDGYTGYLREHLTPAADGDSVAIDVTALPVGGEAWLDNVQPLPSGTGVVSTWTLGTPGRYQVTLAYQVPRLPQTNTQPCAGASEAAVVEFVIGSSPAGSTPKFSWIVVLGATGGLIALALGVFVLFRRRRRGVAAVLLVAVACAALTAGQAPPATADIDSPDPGLNQEVQKCMARFKETGGPTAEIARALADHKRDIVVYPTDEIRTKAGKQHIYNVRSTGDNGRPTGRIWWNTEYGPQLHFDDGVQYEPCAALLHEMTHMYAKTTGQFDGRPCTGSELTVDEVQAVQAENTYRDTLGLPPRKTHNEQEVPALGTCTNYGTLQKIFDPEGTRPYACFGINASRCGRNRGDPHLTTFDNLGYDFQAAGEFVNVRSANGNLEVQTRQVPAFGTKAVTLNNAVAVKLGRDRVSVRMVNGQLDTRLNGRPFTGGALPGGGKLVRRAGWSPYAAGGWSFTWPDGSKMDVDPFGDAWLDLSIEPAPALAGKVSGLLGNFDGKPENDRTPRDGQPLPRDATSEQIYRTFGDSWRVTEATSLFDYGEGETTDTFTDRTVPTAGPELSPEARDRARTVCASLGVTDPALLEACIVDVAHTGQAGFVVSSQVAELTKAGPTTNASGAVRDGDAVTGSVPSAGATRKHQLDLAGASDFFVADWRGPAASCDQSLSVNLVGVSANNFPCQGGAVRFHVPDPAKPYQLDIAALPGKSGPYAFTLVTVKSKRDTVALGTTTTGAIAVRGEEPRYEFSPRGADAVTLTGLAPCPNEILADLADVTTGGVVTGRGLCGADAKFDLPDPAHTYAIMVRSEKLATGSYRFTLDQG